MFNPKNADPDKTVWQMIMDSLINNGITAYPPATKIKECLEEYVVVKQAGGVQVESYSSQWVYYMFLLYEPKNRYDQLDDLERRVTKIIYDELYPMIKPTGLKENDSFDDNMNAHIRAFTYRNTVRNKML